MRLIPLLLLAAACDADDTAPRPVDVTMAGLHVRVEARPPRLQISDGSRLLVDGLPGGFATGSSSASFTFAAGSFKIEESNRRVEAATRLDDLHYDASDKTIHFALRGPADQALGDGVLAAGAADGELIVTLHAPGDRVRLSFACAA